VIILVLNPGSTSTKISIFDEDREVAATVLRHTTEELRAFPRIWDQEQFRLDAVRRWLAEHPCTPDAVTAIGGLLRPLPGGTYRVSQSMLSDARRNLQGEHASNLGCALAAAVAGDTGCPAFVVDPVSVDEFEPPARYSGHPRVPRKTLSHALNIHAVARRAAGELRLPLEQTTFVVGHLGGGISVAAVRGGRIVDVNDAGSDGPFSPERTGGLPLQGFISLAMSGEFTELDLRRLVVGRGGLVAYLGTNSVQEAEARVAAGDADAEAVLRAMTYQIAKEIGAMAGALGRAPDAVVLSGGITTSEHITGWIRERVGFLGRVLVYRGEEEMRALAQGALRVLQGTDQAQEY
jgi:butyrate kinase